MISTLQQLLHDTFFECYVMSRFLMVVKLFQSAAKQPPQAGKPTDGRRINYFYEFVYEQHL